MRNWLYLAVSVVLMTGAVLAAPTDFRITATDAPGNVPSSNLFFLKDYNSSDTYAGNIVVTLVDDGGFTTAGYDFSNFTFQLASFPNDSASGFDIDVETLTWGSEIGFMSGSGNSAPNFTFWINASIPGQEGEAVFIRAYDPASTEHLSDNYGTYIPFQGVSLGTNIMITAPVQNSAESNFVGVDDYTIVADGTSSDNFSHYIGVGSNTILNLNYVDFYAATTTNETSFASSNLLATTLVTTASNVTAVANFAYSGNRANIIKAVGYDPAGNEYPGTDSIQLLGSDGTWVALGQFGDTQGGNVLYGDNLISGNWSSSMSANYMVAGNAIDLIFFETDYYGQRLLSASSAGNINYTVTASATGFDTTYASNVTYPVALESQMSVMGNGTVYYNDIAEFYRQESFTLTPNSSGSQFGVTSPKIVVKHNIINDIVFATSSDISLNSGNGVSTLTPTLEGQFAGNAFSVNIVAVDAYQNITVTQDYGDGLTVTLSGNFNDAYADGYTPFGGTAYSYQDTYPGTLEFSGNAGIIDGGDVTLYRAETNTIIMTIGGASSGEGSNGLTSNDNLDLTVSRNSNDTIILFDDDSDYTNGYIASTNSLLGTGAVTGNAQAAGNVFELYAQISDLYGNPDLSSDNYISLIPYTDASSNVYTTAFRNDSSVTNSTNNATMGNLHFPGLQVDRATKPGGGGNSAIYPFTAFGFQATAANLTIQTSLSPAFQIARHVSDNVYFTNSTGVPYTVTEVSSSSFLSTATAGTNIDFYGAIGDQYGNIDISNSANQLTIDATNFGDAPDGTAGSDNINGAITSGVSAKMAVYPVLKETVTSANLVLMGSSNMIWEITGTFSVNHGSANIVDFVDNTGSYSSGNSFGAGNVAGNAFTLHVGILDEFRNTVTDDPSISGNASIAISAAGGNMYSPSGNYLSSSNTANFSAGYSTANITVYDANSQTTLTVSFDPSNINSTSSPAFDIAPNVGRQVLFVDGNAITNDTFTGNITGNYSVNIITDTTTITAGTNSFVYAAVTDDYGNLLVGEAGNTLTLAAGSATPGASPSGQAAVYGSNTMQGPNDQSIAHVPFMLFDATNTSVGIIGTAGNASYSDNAQFLVTAGTTASVNFLTSAGVVTKTNPASLTDASAPVGAGVAGTPLDDIYIGILDAYGNAIDATVGSLDGNVIISANASYSGTNAGVATVTGTNVVIGVSGNQNSSDFIFFDDSISSKAVTLTGPASSTNTLLDVTYEGTGVTLSGNSNVFFMGDSVPPSITVNAPAAGDELYPGSYNVGWTTTDSDISGTGNVVISLSLDGGTTFSTNLTETLSNSVSIYSWTIAANQTTDQAVLRIQVTDDLGNVGEGFSGVFSISSSLAVMDYAVGDTESDTVNVQFRESVYSYTGSDLAASNFTSTNVTVNSVAHTAGTSSAVFTLSSVLGADNVLYGNVGPISGNVSPNSDGSSAYTSATSIGAANILQLHTAPLGISQTTASSSQNIMGMRLVGWDDDLTQTGNSTLLKQINITITDVSNSVTASDITSVSLYDSNDNLLTLDATPTITIGSSFAITVTDNLTMEPIVGSDNYNYKLGLTTSSTISDSVPDIFKVTVDSVEIIDSQTSDNIQKIYVPHGTRETDPIVADVTPYSDPQITITDPVNANNVATQTLVITGESGADAVYTYYNTDSVGNIHTISDNYQLSGLGVVSANLTVDLSAFSGNTTGSTNVAFSVNVYLLDDAGNQSGEIDSSFTYDLVAPASGNIAMGNISSANVSTANIMLTELETSANTYSIIATDSNGNSISALTGSLSASANFGVMPVDLTSLADGNITLALSLTDDNGNSATNVHVATNVSYKDTTAPTISSVAISSLDIGNFSDLDYTITSDDAAATVTITITDGTSSVSTTQTGSGAGNLIISGLSDGTLTVSANAVDTFGNQGATASNTTILDTTGPTAGNLLSPVSGNAFAQPTFTWEAFTTATNYQLDLYNSSNTLLTTDSNIITTTFAFTSAANYINGFTGNLAVGSYNWQVRGVDEYGNAGAFTGNATFTVDAPDAPVLTAPIGGNVSVASPTFTWEDVNDSASFYFQISAETTGSNIISASNLLSAELTVAYSSLDVSAANFPAAGNFLSSDNFLVAGNYYWRVRTTNSFDHVGSYSSWATFEVQNPDVPSLSSPIAGVVDIASPTLTWGAVSTANTYQVQLSSSASEAGLVFGDNVNVGTVSYAYTSSNVFLTNGTYLAAGEYYWRVQTTDDYANASGYSDWATFGVENPESPIPTSPIDREAVSQDPNFRWSTATGANTYRISIELESNGSYSEVATSDNVSSTNVILSSSLADGVYRWRVLSTDIYNNSSSYSDYAEFSVNIPMLVYVVGDADSNELKAVFNKAVYSNDDSTGTLDTDNIDVSALGGAASVTHELGGTEITILTAQTLSSNTANSDGINVATLAPSATTIVYGFGGAEASTSNVVIRQVAAADNVSAEAGLNYGSDAIELMNFSIGGWSGSNVELKAINYTLTPLSGSVSDSDFDSTAFELYDGAGNLISTSVNVSSNALVGVAQVIELDTAAAVEADAVTSPNFSLRIKPSATTSTDGVVKAFKFELESVVLDIDSMEATRLVSGDEETADVVLTSLELTVTDEDSSGVNTTDELLTVTATNAAADSIASFSWTQTSGEAVTLENAATSAMSFQASGNGVYGFDLSYTRSGYTIVKSISITVITKPQEEALSDLVAEASSIDSEEEFLEAFEIYSTFSNATLSASEAQQLASAAEGLVNQLIANSNIFVPTESQLDNLLAVIDLAVDPSAGADSGSGGLDSDSFDAVESVLTNLSSLAVTGDQTQVGFKVLDDLSSLASANTSLTFTATAFNAVIESLSDAAIQSLSDSGSKSIDIDSSADVKYFSTRLNSGENATAGLSGNGGSILTVTFSAGAGLTPAGSGNSLMLATFTVEDVTGALASTNVIASKIYSINVYETDGVTSQGVTVSSGSGSQIEISMAIDTYVSTQNYQVLYREDGDSAFKELDATIAISGSGMVTFTIDHLTEFVVVESDAPVSSGSGGGGGCLLK